MLASAVSDDASPALQAATGDLLDRITGFVQLPTGTHTTALEEIYQAALQSFLMVEAEIAIVDRPRIEGDFVEATGRGGAQPGLDSATLQPYLDDAKHQQRLLWMYGFTGIFLILVLAGLSIWCVISAPQPEHLALPLIGMGILSVFAVLLGQQARECRRTLAETLRIKRQLLSLDPYLSPLPELAQHLLRGVMVQRLFPRLLDDENPMREDEVFPQAQDLLLALSPELRDMQRRKLAAAAKAKGQATPAAPGHPTSAS
jgi:hypothetical protein